jgi:hypothetical protein
MPNVIAYNKGWNGAVIGMIRAGDNVQEYITKIHNAFAKGKQTPYIEGAFAAIEAYQKAKKSKHGKQFAMIA